MHDLNDTEIDGLEDANNLPLARDLWSKRRMRKVMWETAMHAVNPWHRLMLIPGIAKQLLEGLFDVFLALLSLTLLVPAYLYYVVRFLTFPITSYYLLRYYRGKKYKQSLAERRRRLDLYKFGKQKEGNIW